MIWNLKIHRDVTVSPPADQGATGYAYTHFMTVIVNSKPLTLDAKRQKLNPKSNVQKSKAGPLHRGLVYAQ